MSPDHARTCQWLIGLVETELRRSGGTALLIEARVEARRYADLHHPWDGTHAEPVRRLEARLDVLSRRLPHVTT